MPEEPDFISRRSVPEAATTPAVSVPDHELIRLIGRGSYGEVWLARNSLGAYRAIKIVHQGTFRDKRPFEREFNGVQKFEPVSRLHDGLMDVLQVGRNDAAGYFYCVMELADDAQRGPQIEPEHYIPRTLAHDLARQKRLPIAECQRIGIAIGSALAFLHGRGLIHRDVKPSNIVFVNGLPKLADIGLVAEASEARSYVGTEGFIPPEGPGTVQADLYSFGKVLYEISTGKDRHEYPELPTQLGDSIHETELFEFHKVVIKACRAEPQQRYRSARAMVADLCLASSADSSMQSGRKLKLPKAARVGLLFLGLIGVAIFVMSRPSGRTPIASSPESRVAKGLEGKNASLAEANTSLTTGLVGYWPGDHNALDNAQANDGRADGGVSYVPGQIGQAFIFNNSNAVVKIDAAPDLDVGVSGGFTLEAWIRPETLMQRGPIFEWNDGNGITAVLYGIDPYCWANDVRPGALAANVVDSDFNWHRISSAAGVLVTNTFQQVALTYDQATGVGKIYCGGKMVAQATLGRFTPLTRYDLYLGRQAPTAPRLDQFHFSGAIDEAAVFNRALSAGEIETICQAGLAGKPLWLPTNVTSPKGLVSWWRAETNAADTLSGNDGVLMSGVAFEPGRVGAAFSFNGETNSYIKVPDSASLKLTNELTIEFWVKRRKPFGSDFILNKGGNWYRETVNYGVAIAGPQFKNALAFTFAQGTRSTIPIEDTRWHHCAVTARNGDADPVFYVDGVQRPITKREGPDKLKLYPSTEPLYIGAEVEPPGGWSYYSYALVDEVSIYDRVLSAAQIKTIYEAGRAGKFLESESATVLR